MKSVSNLYRPPMSDDDIMAAVLRKDGAGSGLDADILDGHDASYFAAATNLAPYLNYIYPTSISDKQHGSDHLALLKDLWPDLPKNKLFIIRFADNNTGFFIGYKYGENHGGCLTMVYGSLTHYGYANGTWTTTKIV